MSGACEWFELVQYVESFDMGINFLEGPPGPPGPAGEAIFIPSVSEDGVLSWTNTAGLPNPDPIDLSGPAGTTDYRDLTNKPSINGITLEGNKTTAELLIRFSAADVGLGNVANERQYSAQNPPPYPVKSVNGQTGDVTVQAATDAQVENAVNTWLGNNIDPATGYVLDSTLTMSNAAPPASAVGELREFKNAFPSYGKFIYGEKLKDAIPTGKYYTASTEIFDSRIFEYTKNTRLTNSGTEYPASGYAVTPFISALNGTKLHLSALIDNYSYSNVAFYDENKTLIAVGYNTNFDSNNNIGIGSNYKYVRIVFMMNEVLIATVINAQIEKFSIPWIESAENDSQTIIVDASGLGDYDNIQDAIDNCNDSENNHITIFVRSGTYPRFSMTDANNVNRYISIIGENRADCIVQDNSGNYSTPPAEIRTDGMIKNLTFIATHTENPTLEGLSSYSYALHMDFGGCHTIFENCRFISYQQAAVGIGVWDANPDSDITAGILFRNCELIRRGTEGTLTNGALIVHTTYASNHAWDERIPQNFRMDNCYLEVDSGSIVANIAKTADAERYDFSFANCTVYNRSTTPAVSINITLNVKSFGNNINALNYQ